MINRRVSLESRGFGILDLQSSIVSGGFRFFPFWFGLVLFVQILVFGSCFKINLASGFLINVIKGPWV